MNGEPVIKISVKEIDTTSSDEPLQTYKSQQLFGSKNEIGIQHDGALYRLKITRQGKLILNK